SGSEGCLSHFIKCERHGSPARAGPPWRHRQSNVRVLRRHAVAQNVGRIALTQPLERAIAKLTYALASHTQFACDLLQRHRTASLEAEVQQQPSTVPRAQDLERPRNRLSA